MVDRTYKDIVESGKYSYKKFIKEFDNLINENEVVDNLLVLIRSLG